VTINVKNIDTLLPLQGARVFLKAGAGGSMATGDVIFNTITDVNGSVTIALPITANQPVVGKVRFSTSPNFYKTAPISEVVSSTNGLTLNVALIPD
jgi:hypothetical protein